MFDGNSLAPETTSWVSAMSPWRLTGADPGFPVGGGADPLGGAPIYGFVKFSQNLHEIENILGRRIPLDPPLAMHSLKVMHVLLRG